LATDAVKYAILGILSARADGVHALAAKILAAPAPIQPETVLQSGYLVCATAPKRELAYRGWHAFVCAEAYSGAVLTKERRRRVPTDGRVQPVHVLSLRPERLHRTNRDRLPSAKKGGKQ